ncbi:MAG: hypothetical protein H0V89_08005 [Deltaproteobacteria bacterium]|nr:hypothetical protein [Deltaproteobacteria bacterium]
MARTVRESKSCEQPKNEIPARLTEAALLLDTLNAAGTVDAIALRCLIRREGGYCGADVVLFLLAYFACGANTGLKRFYQSALPWWSRLAAMGGRVQMPSPPAMSRALSSVQSDEMQAFHRWFLTEALDLGPLLTHPVVQHRDAKGRPWHVFHFDPTSPALRQRALPAREGLPDGQRRAAPLCKAGKSGRKRGEVLFTRSVLQHAGSGLWLDMCVEAGHGEQRQQLRSAIGAVVHVCKGIGHPSDMAVICADGQWGGVPSLASFREANTRFVTRLSRYQLLERPEILRALRAATWVLVPDSGSGPQRSATDVGWVHLEASERTLREDGSRFGAERVRLVMTRYPKHERSKKGARGELIDGTVYEMFVTDLDEEGWPAEMVCATYFGRCGQENRFAQENREIQLDRIYAYDPAGQELASVVGAFVWNWRVLCGFLSNIPAHGDVPAQRQYAPKLDERAFPPLPDGKDEPGQPEEKALLEPESDETNEEPRTVDHEQRLVHRRHARALMQKHLPELFRSSHLEVKGWTLDRHRGTLICPNLAVFEWYTTTNNPKGTSPQAAYRTRQKDVCTVCPKRASCRRDPESKRNYRPGFVLPPALAGQVTTPAELIPNPTKHNARPPPLLLPPSSARGRLEVTESALLPAEARKACRRLASAATLVVVVSPLPPKREAHPLMAIDARRRRHGRCTHAENVARYALPDGVTVKIQLRAPAQQLALLAALRHRTTTSPPPAAGSA